MSWSPLSQPYLLGFSTLAGLMFGAGQFFVVGAVPWALLPKVSLYPPDGSNWHPTKNLSTPGWPLKSSSIWIYCWGKRVATMYLFIQASLLSCLFLWSYRSSSVRESCEHSEWIQKLASPGADPMRALLCLSGRPFFFQDLHSAAFLWITTDSARTPQQKYLKPSGSCRLLPSKYLSRES